VDAVFPADRRRGRADMHPIPGGFDLCLSGQGHTEYACEQKVNDQQGQEKEKDCRCFRKLNLARVDLAIEPV